MPQLHETMMGKRFIEGTVPALVKAVEKLTNTLEAKEEPKVEYETMIVILDVDDYNDGRKFMESIENQEFNSFDELRNICDCISVYSLSGFMDMCNNSEGNGEGELDIANQWVGYIKMRKGVI